MKPLYAEKFGKYKFPYHHLPWADLDEAWAFGHIWFYGYEYLICLHAVLREVLKQEPHKVLDFGCGDGRLSYELVKHNIPDIVGVDISERAITFAKAFNLGNQCRFYCVDINELEEYDFDVVVAMEVLEHIPDEEVDDILSAIRARLKQNGHFVVSVPTTIYPVNPKKDYRHYDEDNLRRQVESCFDVISIQYVFKVGWIEIWLRRLVMNRFFIANIQPWVKVISNSYRRYVTRATKENAGHMIATMRAKKES